MAIRRPTNYDATADIIADLEDMADSIQDELDLKVDKVQGKGLSTNDYTTVEKNKLAGIEAQANKTVVDSSLSSSSTNPIQNKKVKEALDTKENTSNKVTSISSSSTNTQYPGAKLLYDKLAEKQEQIDALVEENSTLKKQQLKGQATGSSIQLTDSAEDLEIENVVIKGAMGQETRSGKNVLNQGASITSGSTLGYETGQTTTRGGVQYVRNADKSISYSGTRTDDCTCIVAGHNGESGNWSYNNGYVLPAGTYKVVWENSESNNIVVVIWKYTQEGGYIGLEYSKTETNTNKSGFSTVTVDGETVILVGISAIATYPTQSGTVKIMVVPNSVTDYTYEQYGAMPSIEFLSDINCVTGTNIVKVQNSDASLQQTAPLTLGNIKLYDGDKIQISFINKAGYKKVTGANVVKNMVKYTFTGNENYAKSSLSDENWFCGYISNNMISNIIMNSTIMKASRFSRIGQYTTITDSECIGCTRQFHVRVNTQDLVENSAEAWKNLLKTWYDAGEPLYVVYPLETPETTPITDTTLLNQLETLINMKTYKQITNIETTGSDLSPVLEFQYSKDLQTVIDNMQAQILS